MPIYGTLEVKTQPSNAKVYIDNNPKEAGVTDFINSRLFIGQHHIKIVLAGHKTEEFDVDIKEGQTERINQALTNFCDATIYSTPIANISIDGRAEGKTPLHINRVAGNYQITLSAHGYYTKSQKMHLDGNSLDSIGFILSRNYTQSNAYFQVGCNVGNLLSLNFGIGGYFHNFNIEAGYFTGLTKSDLIYWSDKSGDTVPFTATYKPSGANIKLGYVIRLHNRFWLTPQIGCQILKLKETIEKYSETDEYYQWVHRYESAANGANAISLSSGLRCNVVLSPWLVMSVNPEYLICVNRSKGFKALASISNNINKYSEDFNCNISLNIFF